MRGPLAPACGRPATGNLRGHPAAFLSAAAAGFGAPQPVGRTLFSAYVWPFEMASILLLIGIVGSILLAKRRMR